MQKMLPFLLFFLFSIAAAAQNNFSCRVKDSLTNELLPGVSVVLNTTTNGAITDIQGSALLKNIPDGSQIFRIHLIGYKTKTVAAVFPLITANQVFEILLSDENTDLEEVIVSSTRTHSRIDDLATKIEVLGQEDMDEESTLVPGSVTSILGDLSIITIQK